MAFSRTAAIIAEIWECSLRSADSYGRLRRRKSERLFTRLTSLTPWEKRSSSPRPRFYGKSSFRPRTCPIRPSRQEKGKILGAIGKLGQGNRTPSSTQVQSPRACPTRVAMERMWNGIGLSALPPRASPQVVYSVLAVGDRRGRSRRDGNNIGPERATSPRRRSVVFSGPCNAPPSLRRLNASRHEKRHRYHTRRSQEPLALSAIRE